MSTDVTSVTPAPGLRGERGNLLRGTLGNPLGMAGAVLLAIIVLAGIFAPLLAPQGPTAASLNAVFARPSAQHWLGGDSAGRDVFARLVFGARLSVGGALLATAVATVLGVPSGLIAGYYGRAFDAVASWAANLVMALPAIVVLLALRVVIGSSIWSSMAVFGVLLAPAFFRLVRGAVSRVRNDLYVDAARVAGLSDARIIGKHILGVVRGPVIIQAAMVAAISLLIEAGLEFLGLGDSLQASWGEMLNEGFTNIYQAPQLVLWPGLALGVTCAALALLAGALRDTLEEGGRAPRRRPVRAQPEADGPRQGQQDIPELPGALLSVRGLRVSYPRADGTVKEVIHGIDLGIRPGEVVGLVGESGSGKTQTALSVLGLLPEGGQVSGGAIRFDGEVLGGRSTRRKLGRQLAYIPQEPLSNLDPAYTIGSQLVEPLRVVGGLSASAARERALELLRSVGIADPVRVFKSYPHQVSGGMAQRVLIAGAVSSNPSLLVADEPTTALDVTVQAEILDVLRTLQQQRQMAVLLVTHNFGVVADICDRVYVMHEGMIVETNTAVGIYRDPAEPYTRTLLSHILEGGPSRADLDKAAAPGGAR
jgi:peptide/nickel transport system permease protein